MIEGFVKAHSDIVKALPDNPRVVVRRNVGDKPKVGVVIGGGSGHEPAFLGYVGDGLADGAAVGNIFASPSPAPILAATRAVNTGQGVIYLYGNYAGDCMNFDMAAELAATEGIRVETVLITDDVASAPVTEADRRRGIAGDFFVFKVAGAAADMGLSLDEVKMAAQSANANTRTMGVALSACQVPGTSSPTFKLDDDEIEVGLGIHGEPGVEKGQLQPADKVVDGLVDRILHDMPLSKGDRVAVLVNGLGSTTLMELYILFRRVKQRLDDIGVSIYKSFVGEYVTSLEMGGASITLMKLDDQLMRYLDHPVRTVGLTVQ
ncbi:MAG: dihydroxyacetone kinase subunit DhaK [Alicyclobacillus sp.]|nr:dihydroxyacetone kinase subunit DhaK [Alicyclobacillus sp.]